MSRGPGAPEAAAAPASGERAYPDPGPAPEIAARLAAMFGRRPAGEGESAVPAGPAHPPPRFPERPAPRGGAASAASAGPASGGDSRAGADRAEESGAEDGRTDAASAGGDAGAAPPAGAGAGPAVVGSYTAGGVHYVMYADGSIDAQTPDGVRHFSSLEALKAHFAGGGK
ncbi:hypothetical protein ACFOEX_01620 [Camelimonas abortus]|uniref:Uncharacterized protein n=1 Tax=Camelimonas abortus TaxID=1017184 RepID=A0ABV7LB96_9HYPH